MPSNPPAPIDRRPEPTPCPPKFGGFNPSRPIHESSLRAQITRLETQRDGLLAACKDAVDAWYKPNGTGGDLEAAVVKCSAAISACEVQK